MAPLNLSSDQQKRYIMQDIYRKKMELRAKEQEEILINREKGAVAQKLRWTEEEIRQIHRQPEYSGLYLRQVENNLDHYNRQYEDLRRQHDRLDNEVMRLSDELEQLERELIEIERMEVAEQRWGR